MHVEKRSLLPIFRFGRTLVDPAKERGLEALSLRRYIARTFGSILKNKLYDGSAYRAASRAFGLAYRSKRSKLKKVYFNMNVYCNGTHLTASPIHD